MKKGIIVLLITVLAAGFVFADFSGDAYIQFDADFDAKNYGLTNGQDFNFSFKIDEEVAKKEGESPVHAVIEATANLIVDKNRTKNTLIAMWSNNGSYGIGLLLKIKSAKIVGDNWSVDISGANSSAYDYASASSLITAVKNKKDSFDQKWNYNYYGTSYSVAYAYVNGVKVTYDGFAASFSFKHEEEKGTAYSVTFQTKEFAFSDDMIKVQAAAEASQKAGENTNIGASAKFAFAKDQISAKAAADFGFEGIGADEVKVQFDASLAVAYDFVSATVYFFKGDALTSSIYGTFKDLYLEATVGADLNAFEVPVTVSFAARNLIDKSEAGIDLEASVEYAKDAIIAGAAFGINTEATDAFYVNAYGIYAAENFTAGANVYYQSKAVSFGAFAETSAIIDGATIGVNYGLNPIYFRNYGGSYCVANYRNTNSFAEETLAGTASAYCLIAF